MAYDPPSIVAVSIILPLLGVVAVCLRFWVRLRVAPTYIGIDDWLALAAVIFSLGDGANLALAAISGIQGRDYPDQIPPDRSNLEKMSDHAQVIIEKPLYGMMKLSALFFFRRIFLVQKRFRWYNNIMIVVITAWAVAFMFVEIGACNAKPVVLWDPTADIPDCINQTLLINLTFAITDTIGDILVIVMPYPCIAKLHLSTRLKIGITCIFLLGTLSTIASIIRLYFVSMAFSVNYQASGNGHASGTPPSVWSTIEGAIGVLACCLPPLGPLIRKTPTPHKAYLSLRHKLLGNSSASSDMPHEETKPEKHQSLGEEARKSTSSSAEKVANEIV